MTSVPHKTAFSKFSHGGSSKTVTSPSSDRATDNGQHCGLNNSDGIGIGSFKFIDLFAGIGGIRLGFEAAGGECVFSSEIDKYAVQTYRYMFADRNEHEPAGDITKIVENDIPVHDILVAGFPCQPFSLAGVSKYHALGWKHGFEHPTKGILFWFLDVPCGI